MLWWAILDRPYEYVRSGRDHNLVRFCVIYRFVKVMVAVSAVMASTVKV